MKVFFFLVQLVCSFVWLGAAQLVSDQQSWLRYVLYALTATGAIATIVQFVRAPKKPAGYEGDIDDLAD